MTHRSRDGANLVKFPIGRIVREHRIGSSQATPELEAIEQAAVSIRQAIETLRRQEATLNLCAARARKKVTPEQQARLTEKNMRRIYACEDEDRAAEAVAAPPPDAGAWRALRKLVDKWDAEAGGDDAA
jgi:hypothetical protein